MSALLDLHPIRTAPTLPAPHRTRLRLAGVEAQSIVDGPGIRMTVFTQGCPHRCPGCHNPSTHSARGGFDTTADELLARFDADCLLSGMTLSGGEPLIQAEALLPLAAGVKKRNKSLWCYTGYTFEQALEMIPANPALDALLRHIDVLVDGRYEESLRNPALSHRGSSNQRVLNLPASLKSGCPVFWTQNARFASTRLFRM